MKQNQNNNKKRDENVALIIIIFSFRNSAARFSNDQSCPSVSWEKWPPSAVEIRKEREPIPPPPLNPKHLVNVTC